MLQRGFLLAFVCVALASCSTSSTTVGSFSPPPPAFPRLYATTFDSPPNSLLEVYAPPFTAAPTPVIDIKSVLSKLSTPGGIAIDKHGTVYVINDTCCYVTIYSQPLTVLSTPTTQFNLPVGASNAYSLALDAAGDIWTAGRGNNAIYEYTPPFTNTSTPALTLTAANGLTNAIGIAFDAAGHMAVANETSSQLLIYNPPFTGASMPAATITLPNQGQGVAFDASGNLYVTFFVDPSGVTVYKPPFTNGQLPAFTFAPTALHDSGFPTFDGLGDLWVPNSGNHTVTEFSPPFSAATVPALVLTLSSSSAAPYGVAFGP